MALTDPGQAIDDNFGQMKSLPLSVDGGIAYYHLNEQEQSMKGKQ
jgi:hypothetical protein